MSYKNLAALVLLGVSVGIIAGLETENIVQATILDNEEKFPYQVSVRVFDEHICGGTLIAPNMVLSAAHCFMDRSTNYYDFYLLNYNVMAGRIEIDQNSPVIDVDYLWLHNRYELIKLNGKFHSLVNDIALLKLVDSFPVGSETSINVLRLPSSVDSFVGRNATVTGFGTIYIESENTDDKLSANQYTYRGKSYNLRLLSEIVTDKPQNCKDEKILCALSHEDGAGACRGDSGGPFAFNNEVLIGIVSHGPKDCNDHISPQRYTRVTHYLDWITKAKADNLTIFDGWRVDLRKALHENKFADDENIPESVKYFYAYKKVHLDTFNYPLDPNILSLIARKGKYMRENPLDYNYTVPTLSLPYRRK